MFTLPVGKCVLIQLGLYNVNKHLFIVLIVCDVHSRDTSVWLRRTASTEATLEVILAKKKLFKRNF